MTQSSQANHLYQRAEEQWTKGHLRSAFRLFHAAAMVGAKPAFEPLAQFYDHGHGVRANENAALYWYRRAYRSGYFATAVNNIGCIWRDRGNRVRALMWFRRAVKHGDDDANLNIARIYLRDASTAPKAIPYLKKVCQSQNVTEGSQQQAIFLLKKIAKKGKDL